MAISAGFDDQQFYYQSGEARRPLLDATQLPKALTEAILRHLSALGADEEAMGASLILLSTMALDFDGAPQVLFLGTGGRLLLSHLAALLRMRFSAKARELRIVLAAGRPTAEERGVPETFILDSVDALPAPVAGYDVIVVIDDGTFDALLVKQALAALRPGGHIFCLTSRQSVLTAAASSVRGKMYPIAEHLVCFAGKTSKLRMKKHGKHGKQASPRPAFSSLPPEPTRTMVFLPYKAAMWDCLESIYHAAAADPATRAYVVPIPFAEKNADETIRDWQYEGDQLPTSIPVVDWREIDLAALHPDAIFIHNPFDDWNKVTTVDAHYYTPRLKAITKKLVLVPYFVTGGMVYPELVEAPGYQVADHVIVENDSDRVKFENCYPAKPAPPDKFWPLGSPKFDRVRTDRREDYPLPEAWAKLLAGKRAVLYNTTLVAALQNDVHFLPKLQWVLEHFRAAQDFVLWWRPHPLLLPTLRSMRPELAKVYEQFVADYRAQGWFIYDDTPGLHRAITWADAYYGDIKRVYDHAQSEHRKSIDSAHLCSIYGLPLHMVRSTKNNLKITEPADYYIYRALYDAQENEQVIL